MTISASLFHRQPCDHLVLPYTIVCNEVFHITHAINDIDTSSQAFIDTLFAKLHGFRFIHLLQLRTITVVDSKVVTLGLITHFVIIQLSLTDKSGRVHTKTLDLFPTKLGQYPIILGLPWFRKYLPYIWFVKNTITFDSPHCLQHCLPFHQALTVSGLDILFDNPPYLPTLSNQAVNVFSTGNFAPDSCPHLLSYYRCCSRLLLHQGVNVSSIDKPTNRHSRSTSSSISSQTLVDTNIP